MVAAGDVYIIAHPRRTQRFLSVDFTFLSNGDDGFILVQGDETSTIKLTR